MAYENFAVRSVPAPSLRPSRQLGQLDEVVKARTRWGTFDATEAVRRHIGGERRREEDGELG